MQPIMMIRELEYMRKMSEAEALEGYLDRAFANTSQKQMRTLNNYLKSWPVRIHAVRK